MRLHLMLCCGRLQLPCAHPWLARPAAAVTRVVSSGVVMVQLSVLTKDMDIFGYSDGASGKTVNIKHL